MGDKEQQLAELMRRAIKGEQRAYADLLQQSAQLLRPFLAKRISQRSELDDVLQEILLSLHKARHTYDGARPYLPWLYAIANFRLQDHFRTFYSDQLYEALDISELEESLADELPSEFNFAAIEAEIDLLPAKTAQILRLLHQQGYTAKQVAEQLSMTESAVKVAAHRAYKTLREKLER